MSLMIETPRLLLREIEEGDLAGMYALDSDHEVHKYLGKNPQKSLEESKSVIRSIRKQYEEHGIGRWAVIDKVTKSFIGWAGLKYEKEVRSEMNYYDLGYRLRKEYWGKGIATETAKESLQYGFQVLKLKEIYAGAHIDNLASNKVLQKVGLQFIETFMYDGEAHHWYRISQDEWKEKK